MKDYCLLNTNELFKNNNPFLQQKCKSYILQRINTKLVKQNASMINSQHLCSNCHELITIIIILLYQFLPHASKDNKNKWKFCFAIEYNAK